jgi:membrane protease YdiL (CAAX protease family)|tara:strand:- start:7104 stop:7652 length:549 start_codon:yes stop_codon:yes gene_type:complete
MIETFKNLIGYLKNPVLKKDDNIDLKYRFKIFFQLLLICILTGLILSPIFALFDALDWIYLKDHKVDMLFKNMTEVQILLLGALLLPIVEEMIFRAPLALFKKATTFKIAFYAFTLLFGFMHINNFETTNSVLFLAPILVLPQILVGAYFGYIRVRFGLLWSILLHGSYNAVFIILSFIPEF